MKPNLAVFQAAIRSAQASYAEPVAAVLTNELRCWTDFGYRLGDGIAWQKMGLLVAEIHRHERQVKQDADERALAANGG